MSTISKRDRYRGAMLGVLGGDAALAEFENKKSAEIADMLSRYGGLTLHDYVEPWKGVRHIEAGHPTDDSELTAALAISLVECGGFNPANAFLKLRDFIHGNSGDPPQRRSYLTKGKAYGSGGTLRSALKAPTYEQSLAEFAAGNVRMAPTNGALMRCAPAALVHELSGECAKIGRQQSALTHRAPESIVACSVYAGMLSLVLDGREPKAAFVSSFAGAGINLWQKDGFDDCKASCRKLSSLVSKTNLFRDTPTNNDIWPNSGDVYLSLWASLNAVFNATSYVDGLEHVVRLGGDTDTYGAIAGGLLGAYYGIEGIPKEWREVLIGGDIMIDLADKLFDLAHSHFSL
jgi:ADP-ribosylglycohydrolase